jgi:hypothetical protein
LLHKELYDRQRFIDGKLSCMPTQTSAEWLALQLEVSGLKTLTQLAAVSGINKGTLSKYFNGLNSGPSIDVVGPSLPARALEAFTRNPS